MAANDKQDGKKQPPISPPAAVEGAVVASATAPASPDPEQAKLDAEAAAKAQEAEEAALLAELEAEEAKKAADAAEDHELGRAPRCPDCGERMEPYTGGDANPAKQGTAFCHKCGRRRKVYRNKVVD